MVSSNTLKPVRLFYNHNISTESIAVIFVHTNAIGLNYDGAEERGEKHYQLFKDVLEFNSVKVHIDISKDKVVKILESLKAYADHFQRTKKDKDLLTIAIISIGFNIRLAY